MVDMVDFERNCMSLRVVSLNVQNFHELTFTEKSILKSSPQKKKAVYSPPLRVFPL